jgi:protein SFI1
MSNGIARRYSRARYLRLPTAAPRTTAVPRPTPAAPPTGMKSPFFRQNRRANDTPPDDPEAGPSRPTSPPRPFPQKSTPLARPRSESGLSRPRFFNGGRGDLSPTPSKSSFGLAKLSREREPTRASRPPSSTNGDLSKNKLWFELKEVQRRSRPPTDRSRSRSREPP